MDKESYQPMTNGHLAKRGTKRAFFSIFEAESGNGERGEHILKQWRVFRERKFNFYLDISAFGPSVRVGPRSKVVLRDKGYAWALVLGSFDNSKRYGSSPTRLFSVLRAL